MENKELIRNLLEALTSLDRKLDKVFVIIDFTDPEINQPGTDCYRLQYAMQLEKQKEILRSQLKEYAEIN